MGPQSLQTRCPLAPSECPLAVLSLATALCGSNAYLYVSVCVQLYLKKLLTDLNQILWNNNNNNINNNNIVICKAHKVSSITLNRRRHGMIDLQLRTN